MTLATGAWGQDSVAQNGKDMRQLVEGLRGVDGNATTPGFHLGFKAAAQGSPNATVSVALGYAQVLASGAGLGGMYHVWNDAAINSPSFAATSGNGRWDYLILRVTAGVPALEIVQGTASGSPVAPTITGDNYLPIALVKLPSSVSAITSTMVNDARVFVGKWAEPWGLQQYAELTTNSAGFTALVDSGLAAVTLPASWPANRRVRVKCVSTFQASGAASQVNNYVREGSTAIAMGTETIAANGQSTTIIAERIISPTAGAHTYKQSVEANTAAIIVASGTPSGAITPGPTWIMIEDVGPAANPA